MEHINSSMQSSESETNSMQTNDQNKVITNTSGFVKQNNVGSSQIRYRLQVITPNLNYEIFYLVKPTTVLRRLKKAFIAVTPFNAEEIQFYYKDHRIADDDTPQMLKMNNGDIIVVVTNCRGGCKCHK